MNAKRVVVIVVACASLSLLGGLASSAKFQPKQEVQQDEKIKSKARKQFMRGKLASNQKIVEGLSLKNYALIREGAGSGPLACAV